MDYYDDAAPTTISSSSSRPISAPVLTNDNGRHHQPNGQGSASYRANTAPTANDNNPPSSSSHNNGGGDQQNVRVVARVRPLSTKEMVCERSSESIIADVEKSTIVIPGGEAFASSSAGGGGGGVDERRFEFDAVLGPKSTQMDVYERACGDMIPTSIFRGYNATILAYGQTGSGKTFTMGTDGGGRSSTAGDGAGSTTSSREGANGTLSPSPTEGVISRAVYDLFRSRDDLPNGAERVKVTMSYLEI